MGLRCLHCNIGMLTNRILHRDITLEGMSAFMRDHIHISAASVEVRKDKRGIIVRKICHVTAGLFCLSAKNIEKLIFAHEIHELTGLRRKLPVHPLPRCKYLIRSSGRLRIALREVNAFINI